MAGISIYELPLLWPHHAASSNNPAFNYLWFVETLRVFFSLRNRQRHNPPEVIF